MTSYNYRLAKVHRTYNIVELAEVFRVHKQTVQNWIKDGLHVCSRDRPILIRGIDAKEYLQAKRTRNKKSCLPGQIYCVACKVPRSPKNQYAIVNRQTFQVGSLIGECPACGTTIYRRVSLSKIDSWKGNLRLSEMKEE